MARKFFGRGRRGIALVLMVMMMSIFILAAAFSADFGRMYLIRSQLQTAADAAALAAVASQSLGVGATSKDTGKVYVYNHYAAGRANLDTAIADVIPGSWVGSSFVADPDLLWAIGTTSAAGNPYRDAVRVVVRDTVPFTFGRFMGWDKRVLTVEAVATWGSGTSSTCTRPWAIPYQQLLDQLFTPGSHTPSYNMTIDDIAALSAMTYASNPVSLKVSTDNGTYTSNGQFYAVNIPPAEYADGTAPASTMNGGNDYRNEIMAQTCSALRAYYGNVDPTVHIGDYLSPETGNMQGPTQQGISGQGQTPGLCGTSNTCSPPVKVIAALWDTYGASPGGHCGSGTNNGCYHIKYFGEFTLIGFDQPTKTVKGYFNVVTLPADGATGFTPGAVSSVKQIVLVK